MRMALWVAVLSIGLLGVTVESAIIRIYRIRGKIKMDNETLLTSSSQTTSKPKKSFRATESRCCRMGEKVAKRKLSCDVRVVDLVSHFNDLQRAKIKYNRPRKIVNSKISARLSTKLRKCVASFPKYFEKCCKYREQFYQSMAKCKLRHDNKERRRCRQSVRKRYKSPSSSRKKQRKPRRRNTGQKQT